MRQYIADAFAEELFTGNPAAVLPCKQMPEAASPEAWGLRPPTSTRRVYTGALLAITFCLPLHSVCHYILFA